MANGTKRARAISVVAEFLATEAGATVSEMVPQAERLVQHLVSSDVCLPGRVRRLPWEAFHANLSWGSAARWGVRRPLGEILGGKGEAMVVYSTIDDAHRRAVQLNTEDKLQLAVR
ncbi:hypothetical protein CCUG60884_00266 [Mycobacteroides salmoniphilum]|uniref:Uncharacterized protein n=1 Tax=Mycobacteroides salmoniphilum TaxID=404941 RepID=A0A4R8SZP8_9MYCO|nr:hypothetical protein CCUG60884_00266 [Mycobacteroides salmoniphilum]